MAEQLAKVRGYAVVIDDATGERFRQMHALKLARGVPVRTVAHVLAEQRGGALELPLHPDLRATAARLFDATGDPAWRDAAEAETVSVAVDDLSGRAPGLPAEVGYELIITPEEQAILDAERAV